MDANLFSDVADALQIEDPAIVEKDYYVIQLLKSLSELRQTAYHMVFAGGTCLAKTYENIQRMSEDLDIKLKPINANVTEGERTKFKKAILNLIDQHPNFNLVSRESYDGGRTRKFEISYPSQFEKTSSLRPNILLEIVEKDIYEPIPEYPIASMCSEVLKQTPEIDKIKCVNLNSIIAEKIISLLWRTAALEDNIDIDDDEALIRHIYDIHRIYKHNPDIFTRNELISLANKVLESDSERYGNKYPKFKNEPDSVIEKGLQLINSDIKHANRYDKCVKNLIYSIEAPEWSELQETLNLCYANLFGEKN